MQQNKIDPAVVSMSLGGPFSQSQNDAVQSMFNAGIVVSVAAGNEDEDACISSPASLPAVCKTLKSMVCILRCY